jgi:cytochrome c-type biogenesis protein CcmH/NrfG
MQTLAKTRLSTPTALLLGFFLLAVAVVVSSYLVTPRYQLVGQDGIYVRLDMRSGATDACLTRTERADAVVRVLMPCDGVRP